MAGAAPGEAHFIGMLKAVPESVQLCDRLGRRGTQLGVDFKNHNG